MLKTEGNIRKSYSLYKTLTKEPEDVKTYISIANDYMKFLSEKVLGGDEVTLPGRMGILSVVGVKIKLKLDSKGRPNLFIDWGETNKLWDRNPQAKEQKKLVYFLNEDTAGVRYKFFWSKQRMILENKSIYAFKIVKANRKALNRKIKEGQEYFIKNN